MKSIELSTATKPLAEYARDLDDDFVLLTSNNKPVFAIVSLKNIDPDSLALSTNPEFLEIIEQARREVAAGETISLEDVKREIERNAHPSH